MPAIILNFVLGPLENNSYLIANDQTGEAAVIDPSFGSRAIIEEAAQRGYLVRHIWLTHAHFDHIAGVGEIIAAQKDEISIALHPDDLGLWKKLGGAAQFGFHIQPLPVPTQFFAHGQNLHLGNVQVEVRHTPGHTPGHVILYCPSAETVFSGDLIFQNSIGRTDLPGGDYDSLLTSIHTQVLTLPPQTQLLSGHGPATSVADERRYNPFLY